MMLSRTIAVPDGWDRRPAEECDPEVVEEWVRESESEREFVVRLSHRSSKRDELVLSTIVREATDGREEYRVATYDEQPAAVDDLERFIEHLTDELENGTLSAERTSKSAPSRAILDFTGGENWLARILFRFYG